jgi:hypothetical protein
VSTRVLLTTLALLALAACNEPGDRRTGMIVPPATDAGSSGIAPSRLLNSLSPAEAETLCENFIATTSSIPAGTECDGGITFEATTVSECAGSIATPPAGCAATVGNVQDCGAALARNACVLFSDPACIAIVSCASSAG